ncbi:hypothetical protein D3C78_1409990 [compost metagenome]
MAGIWLAISLDYPYPMLFEAHGLRIQVLLAQYFTRVNLLSQFIGVVGNKLLLLTDQLEVKAIHTADEAEDLIPHQYTTVSTDRQIIGKVRSATCTALTRGVEPYQLTTIVRRRQIEVQEGNACRLRRTGLQCRER